MGHPPLVPFEPQPPDRPQPHAPARYVAPSTPLHMPGAMGLRSGGPLRDACWNMLSHGVRAKLAERAGRTIEWWASDDGLCGDGRPTAVVLGERGLAIAEPRINTQHRPVYSVATYVLDPSSFKRQRVDHRPARRIRRSARSSAPQPAAPIAGVDTAASGKLGNLPSEAQKLLQSPFLDGASVTRCDWHYEGNQNHLGMFMIYLAGRRAVTAAMGSKIIPAGHTDATAHWSLTCVRASVLRCIGA